MHHKTKLFREEIFFFFIFFCFRLRQLDGWNAIYDGMATEGGIAYYMRRKLLLWSRRHHLRCTVHNHEYALNFSAQEKLTLWTRDAISVIACTGSVLIAHGIKFELKMWRIRDHLGLGERAPSTQNSMSAVCTWILEWQWHRRRWRWCGIRLEQKIWRKKKCAPNNYIALP